MVTAMPPKRSPSIWPMFLVEYRAKPNLLFQLAIREGKLTRRISTFVRALITYPDEYKDWYHYGVEAGHNLLREKQFDALLSSSECLWQNKLCHDMACRTYDICKQFV